jgi:arylsulfatase A-like enzyme
VSAQFGFGRGFERYEEDRKGGFANAFPQVERWLSEVGDQPFFLFLHTYDIHAPYDPPPPFADYFYSGYQGPVEPQQTLELVDRVRERKQFADGHAGPVDLDAADRRRLVALYDGGIRYTDQYIGRLLADLEDNGLLDETILIVLADHGEEFWDHDSLGHGHTIYQEQLHVPLLWRLPHARLGGRRVDAVVRLVDVAPTVLEALHFPPEASFEGESLLPLLRGEERQQRVAVSQAAGLKSVIDYPWKLILDTETRQSELYNLAADPEEETSLAGSEIAQLRRLKELLTTESGPRVTDEERPGEEEISDELREQLKALGYLQ